MAGIPVFQDVTFLSYGTAWKYQINRAIRKSRVFLHLHPTEAKHSDYLIMEIEKALKILHTHWLDHQLPSPIKIKPVSKMGRIVNTKLIEQFNGGYIL